MDKTIKNIEHNVIMPLSDQVDYQSGQIASKTLAQNRHHSITLFAFDKGEEISTHETNGDALVYVLDGTGKITIGETDNLLHEGDSIVMPAKVPHAVFAQERFKMLLVVVFLEAGEES
ncbi:MAG: cupin domain-containing protein [Eubacteriaceae bacterium]|nr:cupin domain-containing protein [Eubacteriaceae bacterium]